MEFLKNHSEKILLALALVGLMAAAVLLSRQISHVRGTIVLPEVAPRRKPPDLDTNTLARVKDAIENPPVWRNDLPLFNPLPHAFSQDPKTGVPILVPTSRVVIVTAQIGQVPCEWFKKYNLPCDPGMDEKDSDGDGWSNKQEWKLGTNPADPKSEPTAQELLAFVAPIREQFPLLFKGYANGGNGQMTFQINVRDFNYTYMNGLGEQVSSDTRKENYKIEKFESATKQVYDPSLGATNQVDVSRLTLTRLDDGAPIILTIAVAGQDRRLKARLMNRLEDGYFTVSKGEEFKIRGDIKDQTYKVIDIKEDRVLIIDPLNREFNIQAPTKTGE